MSLPTAAPTPTTSALPAELLDEALALRAAPAEELLAWLERRLGARAAIASSFGVEDMVLIDLARKHAPSLRVFTLDTGRLPPETYELIEVVRNRYGVHVETYFPERGRVEALESEQGFFSFRRSLEARKACCAIRKVEPLERALRGRDAWVTGLRREQSTNRADVDTVEHDREHGGLLKLNPLAAWTRHQVWEHVRAHAVPYNALHDRGYPSIGCAPCTRAVKPYEDERAGRWWWEAREHTECGLHPVR
ncbi:phosphoadenylyl-sulfate reductase [Myxococcus stipitatus]|uniref:phosphoadenylyl-sulfate reductase n=1 Tax=Myxococcus stipitatus TaxID=83455 RepID=UPI001F3B7C44|nr:phosphoadenylyl-sulfate reductase [Myxococcus stipitatus]MCE9666516.1 phosphoadenylyl-sulfate reductase [Myxococcus stipitatus]